MNTESLRLSWACAAHMLPGLQSGGNLCSSPLLQLAKTAVQHPVPLSKLWRFRLLLGRRGARSSTRCYEPHPHPNLLWQLEQLIRGYQKSLQEQQKQSLDMSLVTSVEKKTASPSPICFCCVPVHLAHNPQSIHEHHVLFFTIVCEFS